MISDLAYKRTGYERTNAEILLNVKYNKQQYRSTNTHDVNTIRDVLRIAGRPGRSWLYYITT